MTAPVAAASCTCSLTTAAVATAACVCSLVGLTAKLQAKEVKSSTIIKK
jgi:hypothetical protein